MDNLHTTSSHSTGPSPEQWSLYRKTIVDLYKRRTLREVREQMEQRFSFRAT